LQLKNTIWNYMTWWSYPIIFSTTRGTISTAFNNNNGTYSWVLTSSTGAWVAILGFSISGVTSTNTTSVTFVPSWCYAQNTILTGSPSMIVANGLSQSLITADCYDFRNNRTNSWVLSFSTNLGTLSWFSNWGSGIFSSYLTSSPVTGDATVTLTTTGSSKSTIVRFVDFCELTNISVGECNALRELYRTTNGSWWLNKANWLTDYDVNNWFGVTVSEGRVVWLNLSNASSKTNDCELVSSGNNLSWFISPALNQLTGLTQLCLGNNSLGWLIPSLVWLSQLQTLSLHHNQLIWTVAPISNPSLTTLDLSNNIISQSPSQLLGLLPLLQRLRLNHNRLSHTLNSFTLYSQLQSLRLNNNMLVWGLPTAWTTMNLSELLLSSNNIDRNSVNQVLLLPSLVSRYSTIGLTSTNNQLDVTPPTIGISGSISGAISSTWWIVVSLLVNENSISSWLVTGWPLSWSVISGMPVSITGSAACMLISATPVWSHTWVSTLILTPYFEWAYSWCQLFITDRWGNQSNYISLWSFDYSRPPLRLHLSASDSSQVSWWLITARRDLSPFGNPITTQWSIWYVAQYFGLQAAAQPNSASSLLLSWVLRNELLDVLITFAVVQSPTSGSIFAAQWPWGSVDLSSSSWKIKSSTLSFSAPTAKPFVITASHRSTDRDVRINGQAVANTVSNETLLITGVSTNIALSWFWWSFGELLVYTKELTSALRQQIESYLAIKYGITLTTTYTALSNPNLVVRDRNITQFNNGIIWIAKDMGQNILLDQPFMSSSWTISLFAKSNMTTGQYVIAGHDNEALAWNNTTLMIWFKALDRSWRIQSTGNPSFTIGITSWSLAAFTIAPLIIVSSDPSFSTIYASWYLTSSGSYWVSSWITVPHNYYITFAVGNGSIWWKVWLDVNRDGISSPSEPEILWVKVSLRACANWSNTWVPLLSTYSGQIISQITTSPTQKNPLFESISPGSYYMEYNLTQIQPSSDYVWVVPTSYRSLGQYDWWPTRSDWENYALWSINKPFARYWNMSTMWWILAWSLDSDVQGLNNQWLNVRSTPCYYVNPGISLDTLGAWFVPWETSDLMLTHTLDRTTIPNSLWQTITLAINVNNNSVTWARMPQVLVTLPEFLHVTQVLNAAIGNPVSYVSSGSDIKINTNSLTGLWSVGYIVYITYDGNAEDTDILSITSSIRLLSTDSIISNNTPSPLTIALINSWSNIWNMLWIDSNTNGIFDNFELGTWGVTIELRSCTGYWLVNGSAELPLGYVWPLLKTIKTSTINGEYLFTSIPQWQYYLRVANLPRWHIFTTQHAWWIAIDNNSNISQDTNLSNCFAVNWITNYANVDIWIRPVTLLTNSTTYRKLRVGQQYQDSVRNQLYFSNSFGSRIYQVESLWNEKYDYNESSEIPNYTVFAWGLWNVGWIVWHIPAFGNSPVLIAGGAYTPIKSSRIRTTSDLEIAYDYYGCYVLDVLPTICLRWFRNRVAYSYEITSCGDNVIDSFDATYVWADRWTEQCDYGTGNGNNSYIRDNKKCTNTCQFVTSNAADLWVAKNTVKYNICQLPSGTNGSISWVWGSWSQTTVSGWLQSQIITIY
jgi:hypothetical protein